MTKHLFPMNTEHVLGSVGLFVLIVVGKLADRGYGHPRVTRIRIEKITMNRRTAAAAAKGER